MKSNRKRSKKMSVVASHTMHLFGVIVVLFAMVIVNMLASSSCSQLQKANGEKEKVIKKLENDRVRELGRWDGMKTLDRLETALVRHGLNMKYPKSIQIIHMDGRGQPLVAQNSVKEARRRQGLVETASYKPSAPVVVARATSAPRVASVPRVKLSSRRKRR